VSGGLGSLSNRVALITGGARGLGRQIAICLAAEGAAIAVTDVGGATSSAPYPLSAPADLDSTVDELRRMGARALAIEADVRVENEVRHAFEQTREELGPIDIVVGNAGISHWASPWEFPLSAWDDIVATNLRGAWLVTFLALPDMMERNWGRIVYMSSVAAFRPSSKSAAYAATKAGLVAMAKSIAVDVAPHGITVNTVHPGVVDTGMVRGITGGSPEELEKLVHRNLIKGAVPATAVADAVAWLCRPAGAHMTGQAIVIDNGYLLS
jgi:NAD(P)-dependent dehydrogenase (short-subunit alcohol dehydrogenase family)